MCVHFLFEMSGIAKLNHKQRRKLWIKDKRRRKRVEAVRKDRNGNDSDNNDQDPTPTTNYVAIKQVLSRITITEYMLLDQTKAPENPDANEASNIESAERTFEEETLENNVTNQREESVNKENSKDDLKNLLQVLDEEVEQWHNPLAPDDGQINGLSPKDSHSIIYKDSEKTPEVMVDNRKPCMFYSRVGACRFGDSCSHKHSAAGESDTLLFPNMFQTFAFEITERNTRMGDVFDVGLEHTDDDLYGDFLEFYEDVLPEFRNIGRVERLIVCCNRVKHLCGNVYVQYSEVCFAKQCFEKMNNRFYNGKQLSCRYVSLPEWRSALCGLYLRNRNCPRGDHCNFLHAFSEPRTQRRHRREEDREYCRRRRSRSRSRSKKRKKKTRNRHSSRSISPDDTTKKEKHKKSKKSKEKKRKKHKSDKE